jgi:hypothetical protein
VFFALVAGTAALLSFGDALYYRRECPSRNGRDKSVRAENFACLSSRLGAKVLPMKIFSPRSLLFGAVLVGISALGSARLGAQVATNAPGGAPLPAPILDNDEMTQLNHAREKVFSADPDLKAESEKLKAMHDSTNKPTDEQRNAAFAEWKAYQKKMRAEMLKVDPSLGPIFTKIDAARKNGAPTPFQPAPAK